MVNIFIISTLKARTFRTGFGAFCIEMEYNHMDMSTDYGRMMAISQILFDHYRIWVRSEKQSFLVEKTTE
jgi:hypothetical protein